MTRAALLAVVLCLLPGLVFAGMPAGKSLRSKDAPLAPSPLDAQSARPRPGPQLTVPRTARLGEPFLIRLRSAGPLSGVRATWLSRQAALSVTPVPLRESGGSVAFEALALLGTDIGATSPGPHELSVRLLHRGRPLTLRVTIQIVPAQHPVEELSLDEAMVNPPPEAYPRINAERQLVQKLLSGTLSRPASERLWTLPLARPVPGELSSEYGLGRVLNGQPRAPHRGMDLCADTGEPVRAAADGVVLLAADLYFAGQAVYLDHGQGLVTAYFHLSELRVQAGTRVARGQVLGLAGATGRSTRPHLHFGVWAFGRAVDPGPLFGYEELP